MSALGSGPACSGHVPLVKVVVTEALDAVNVPVLPELLDGALALRPERLVADVADCPHIDNAAVAELPSQWWAGVCGRDRGRRRSTPGCDVRSS